MPAKYVIHTTPAAPRLRPVGKLGIVDWREDCSSCHNCVKRACVYGLYRDEADTLRDEVGYLDYIYQCKGCLNCVQNCTKNILTRVVNPEYRRLGDELLHAGHHPLHLVQAETGRIPVSGSGYGGPFSGPGFDSMWTDMSEIVRPTRDGIHGREYISTSVDIGRKLPHLAFADGQLSVDAAAAGGDPAAGDLRRDSPSTGSAGRWSTAVVPRPRRDRHAGRRRARRTSGGLSCRPRPASIPLLETDAARRQRQPVRIGADGDDPGRPRTSMAVQAALKQQTSPSRIVAIRVPATPAAAGARRSNWPATGRK